MMFSGFQIRNMSQAWLTLELTDSSLWVGLVNAMPGIGIITLSLLGGAVADRSERWHIEVRTRFVIAIMAFLTAFLVTTGTIEAWHLIPIGLFAGTMFAFHNPASQAFAVDIVGKEKLLAAISLNTTISNVATIGGPALGGALLALGIDYAFYALGILYSIAFISTFFIRTRSTPNTGAKKNVRADIVEGIRYSVSHPLIKWIFVFALGAFFVGVYMAIYPIYARDELGVGEVGFGTMLAMQGVGALVGSTFLVLKGNIKRKAPYMFGAMMLMHGTTSVLAFTSVYGLTLVMMLGSGVAFGVWMIMVPTMLQTIALPEMRGRVMSIYFMSILTFQIGGIAGGAIETTFGLSPAFLFGAAGGIGVAIFVFLKSPALRAA